MSGFFFDSPSTSWLNATANDNGTVTLAWPTQPAPNVTIERKAAADSVFTSITSVASDKTYTDSDSALIVGGVYDYRAKYMDGAAPRYSDTVQVTITYTAPPQAAGTVHLGHDDTTQGHWNGKYGGDGYVLVGLNRPLQPGWASLDPFWDDTANPGWQYNYVPATDDLHSLPSYVSSYAYVQGDRLSASPDISNDAGWVLDMPAGVIKDKMRMSIERGGGDLTVIFNLTDNSPHVFSAFSTGEWSTGAKARIFDLSDNLLAESPMYPTPTFGNGAYVSFMVQGSFKITYTNPANYFVASGFFFDAPITDKPTLLSVAAAAKGRTISVDWTNAGGADKVIVERSTNDAAFAAIAELTNGETSYVDQDLTPDQTYYYRLRNVKGLKYGLATDSMSDTVPHMDLSEVTIIDPVSGVTVDQGQTVTVKAKVVKISDSSFLAGKTVYLRLVGPNVGDGVSQGQEIPEALNNGVTGADGQADITFTAQYIGQFEVEAYTLPDDDANINGDVSPRLTLTVNPAAVGAENPVILKVSDAVSPGGLFSVNGAFLNDDASLKIWYKRNADGAAPAGNSGAAQADIIQRDKDGYFAVAKLPDSAAAGVYDIWAENAVGVSARYQMNAARPLFMSDYEIYPGIEVEVAGRNFAGSEFGAPDSPAVRLYNGTGYYAAAVNSFNPYNIAFTVGSGVPTGTYEVQVSNDGANWAALKGQTLTVTSPGEDPLGLGVAWASDFNWANRVNVELLGADPSDTADDTDAVQAAVNQAAASGGVVYFPNGNYYIRTITLPSGVVLLGESQLGTKLYYTGSGGVNLIQSPDAAGTNSANAVIQLQGVSNMSLLLEDQGNRPDSFMWLGQGWGAYGDKTLRTANRIFVTNVTIDYPTDNDGNLNGSGQRTSGRGIGLEFVGHQRMLVKDNHFTGWHAQPFITGWNQYYILKNNYFEYTFGYVVSLSAYFFAEDNHVKAVHSEKSEETHGIFGRNDAYMAGNLVENMGAINNNYNDGEPLCVEVPNGYFNHGGVLSATANSIFVAPQVELKWPTMDFGDLSVMILGGRGMGQLREVQSIAGYTITVKEPFDITPDHTSKFTLIAPNDHATFYNNTVKDNAKGIWLFGNSFDGVVADNTSIDSEGVFIWSNNSGAGIVPDYYSRVTRNTIEGVSRRSGYGGIGFNTGRSQAPFFATDIYSTEILQNTIIGGYNSSASGDTEAPSLNGIYLEAAAWASSYDNVDGTRDAVNTLVLGNTLDVDSSAASSGREYNVNLSHSNYGQIIKDNKYAQAIATFLTDTHTIAADVANANTLVENNVQTGETVPRFITEVEPISVSSVINTQPSLPDKVRVTYNDGSEEDADVTWDAVPPELLASEGSFKVYGTVADTQLRALAEVTLQKGTYTGSEPTTTMYVKNESAGSIEVDLSQLLPAVTGGLGAVQYEVTAPQGSVEVLNGQPALSGQILTVYYNSLPPGSALTVRIPVTVHSENYYDFTVSVIIQTTDRTSQPAPPAFELEYELEGDGSYTVTIPEAPPGNTGAEYSFDGISYGPVRTLKGCAPGESVTGYVRYAGDQDYSPSPPTSASVTLPLTVQTFALTLRAGTGGRIIKGTDGAYPEGTVIPIEAQADADYIFQGWTSSGGGAFDNANSAAAAFTMPDNDVTITADFAIRPPSGGGGNGGENGGGNEPGGNGNNGGGGTSGGSGSSGGGTAPAPTSTPAAEAGRAAVTPAPTRPPVYKEDGSYVLPDGGIIPMPNGVQVNVPGNSSVDSGGSVTIGDGSGSLIIPTGTMVFVSTGTVISGEGNKVFVPRAGNALVVYTDGAKETVLGGHTIEITDRGGIEVSFDNPFADVSEADWFYNDVAYVYGSGLMNGMGGDAFGPGTNFHRGMLVTILSRLYGADLSKYAQSTFIDVDEKEYYAMPIEWGLELGIVAGVGENRFAPEADISRQDLAVILKRFADATDLQLPEKRPYTDFTDEAECADYARAAIEALFKAGVINGRENGRFDPKGSATRAEAAAMLHRFADMAKG
ncbi:MAG: S-layer homology domain-containing protein [Clostridiales bacterium]|nr:S-layer homology domain-containing protein [Clostridiales bacterium]